MGRDRTVSAWKADRRRCPGILQPEPTADEGVDRAPDAVGIDGRADPDIDELGRQVAERVPAGPQILERSPIDDADRGYARRQPRHASASVRFASTGRSFTLSRSIATTTSSSLAVAAFRVIVPRKWMRG